ncbi:MAG: STT3 domain-containing protein [Candidatus Odinarchaeota archaeon]
MPRIVDKILDNLKDRWNFARTKIDRSSLISLVTLGFILLIGFLIRILPYLKYDYVLKANDPFSQLKAAEYMNAFGIAEYFDWSDPTTWYPYSRPWGITQYIGTPLAALVIYYISNIIGISISIQFAAYLEPAILGTFTCYATYLLGKELANKRVGLIAGFFLAIAPGHIQRSMVGFFDNEALGVFLLVLGLYLFARSLRTGSLGHAIGCGIVIGFLGASWGGATYIFQLLALFTFIILIMKRYSTRLLTAYGIAIPLGLIVASLVPRNGPSFVLGSDGLIPLGILALLLLVDFYARNQEVINRYIDAKLMNRIVYSSIALGVVGFAINLLFNFVPLFGAKFISVLVPFFRVDTPILKSVAEHLIMTWGGMFHNLYFLTFLIPIGILYTYQKPTERNILMLLFAFTTLYFSASMVRLILILSPAAAIIAGKAIDETLLPFALTYQEKFALSKRKLRVYTAIGTEHVAFAYFTIFVILGLSLGYGQTLALQSLSPPAILLEFPLQGGGTQKYNDWFESLAWLDQNADKNDVIVSWWDYGYWISVETNKTILVDNATINSTQIGNVGAFMMANPKDALKVARIYDITFAVVLLASGQGWRGFDNDLGKCQWMIKIAEASGNILEINSADYFSYQRGTNLIESYTNKFYDSLFWGMFTADMDSLKGEIEKQGVLKPLDDPTYSFGWPEEYAIYSNVFKDAYTTSNNWIRIFEIDYDAADSLGL